ncbi:integumentary mucin C.1-like [Lampris incognitus]|uniref:integumentary mucin C.1-like n=1 Tax=Lampris incognitus TaxID=2546036 RepID=UPI0024B60D7B|nr:integumentary mucin C.1-like [Lampris incognitus]
MGRVGTLALYICLAYLLQGTTEALGVRNTSSTVGPMEATTSGINSTTTIHTTVNETSITGSSPNSTTDNHHNGSTATRGPPPSSFTSHASTHPVATTTSSPVMFTGVTQRTKMTTNGVNTTNTQHPNVTKAHTASKGPLYKSTLAVTKGGSSSLFGSCSHFLLPLITILFYSV